MLNSSNGVNAYYWFCIIVNESALRIYYDRFEPKVEIREQLRSTVFGEGKHIRICIVFGFNFCSERIYNIDENKDDFHYVY